jgi:hypothetical protein
MYVIITNSFNEKWKTVEEINFQFNLEFKSSLKAYRMSLCYTTCKPYSSLNGSPNRLPKL